MNNHLNTGFETWGKTVLFTLKTIIFLGVIVVHHMDAYLGIFEKATFSLDGPLLHLSYKLLPRTRLQTQVRDAHQTLGNTVWETKALSQGEILQRSFAHCLLFMWKTGYSDGGNGDYSISFASPQC